MGLTEEEWGQIQANLARNRPPAAQAAPDSSTIVCPRCGKACGNTVDAATRQTLHCQFCDYPKTEKVSKHRNRKTLYQGLTFDSEKECTRWQELQLFERVGAIKDLRRQVSYDLYACNGERIARYVADFTYYSLELGFEVIEDAKSPHSRTLRDYRLKFKLMRAQGQAITEV